jgi:hypothetical protein
MAGAKTNEKKLSKKGVYAAVSSVHGMVRGCFLLNLVICGMPEDATLE